MIKSNRFIVTMCFMCPLLVLIKPSPAAFTPTLYEARRAATAPSIDGSLDDVAWRTAQVIDRFYQYKSGGVPAESTGRMRVLWDDKNLYLGMQIDDANILPSTEVSGRGGFDGPLYEGDVIEFFVRQTASSPQYHEFEFGPTGDQFDARFDTRRFGPPGTAWNSGVQSAVRVTGTALEDGDVDTGWFVEASIPLAAFDPVSAGVEWFFTFARYDFFQKGDASTSADLMMSTPGDPTAPMGGVTIGFHTYEIYDRLRFTSSVPGDFNGNGSLDADDIDLLSAEVRVGGQETSFDLNQDGSVNRDDRRAWVDSHARTYFGDANLDGQFDTRDLVAVFQVGEFEDGIAGNSTWSDGDWDGDADFGTGDFVLAFQSGGFEKGPRTAVVPEPSSATIAACFPLVIAIRWKR